MKQWTFQKQIAIGILLLFVSGILAAILHNGVFLNLAWILYGLLFAIHPVYPEQARLRYSKADGGQQPLISITYYLQNGTDRTISANRTTVWWKGKSYAIKDPGLFVNLTEGIFFLAEVQGN